QAKNAEPRHRAGVSRKFDRYGRTSLPRSALVPRMGSPRLVQQAREKFQYLVRAPSQEKGLFEHEESLGSNSETARLVRQGGVRLAVAPASRCAFVLGLATRDERLGEAAQSSACNGVFREPRIAGARSDGDFCRYLRVRWRHPSRAGPAFADCGLGNHHGHDYGVHHGRSRGATFIFIRPWEILRCRPVYVPFCRFAHSDFRTRKAVPRYSSRTPLRRNERLTFADAGNSPPQDRV